MLHYAGESMQCINAPSDCDIGFAKWPLYGSPSSISIRRTGKPTALRAGG